MKVQTKMSSNLCCCLGEEATLCVPNSSSDIDGWVPPKHELWKAGGGWVWSNVGISRSRVRTNGVKGPPYDMKSKSESESRVSRRKWP